ncbi:unnamed protein product [Heligmosomoides polygyrus]|uniref:EF-hand domain-containing protein n=1 Tax=Heligmosomoides polygyrus TaxID=6339 RepID=A0A183G8I6_HELPZ|nr:unnamed protein product [Heligmosomoides polygyrus]
MYDLNKDHRLDGIDILKAVTDDHSSGGSGAPVADEDHYVSMIDSVLKEMDFNGDGYIDFAEYMKFASRE